MIVSFARTGNFMNIQVKSLCESGKISEAIDLASKLSNDGEKVENLKAIGTRVLKEEKSASKDLLLGKLFFALGAVGSIEQAMYLLKHFHKSSTAATLEVLLNKVVAHRQEALRSA